MSKPASDASFKVVEQMKRRHGLGGRRIRAVSYGMTPEPPTPQPAPSPSLKRHELSELFGPMDPATYADLVADVRARGRLDHPVVLHEDRVIDGWHRYLACLEANVEPKFVQWADIDNGGDPLDPKRLPMGLSALVSVRVGDR